MCSRPQAWHSCRSRNIRQGVAREAPSSISLDPRSCRPARRQRLQCGEGGVRLLTKSAALECADAGYNIRVNSVHPGYIDTPMVKNVINRGVMGGAVVGANEMREMLIMLHPVGRLCASRSEIANAILFLASDESSFMTGVGSRRRWRVYDALISGSARVWVEQGALLRAGAPAETAIVRARGPRRPSERRRRRSEISVCDATSPNPPAIFPWPLREDWHGPRLPPIGPSAAGVCTGGAKWLQPRNTASGPWNGSA